METDASNPAAIARAASVPAELAGLRFDVGAARLWPEFSRSRLRQWIETGELTLDGRPAAPRALLRDGQQLALSAALNERPELVAQAQALPLTIAYADADILVIDKPAGLVVHPGAGNPDRTLQNGLLAFDPSLAALPRAGIVHRLDKDTGGLLLVARTPAAQVALVRALERREIRRAYRAVCCGALTGGGSIEAPLGRHPRDRLRQAVVTGAREARTHYRVRERFRAHTDVDIELDTGRTHQIRVHFAHIRAPLVGDPLYGGRLRLPKAPSPALIERLRGFRRQALHAAQLGFAHPATGQRIELTSPLPADFEGLLAVLRADRDGAA